MSEGNVQLKLQASLDLSFLRAQVASLGKSLQAENVSVVATLDAKQLQKDVAKLGKEITLKVNDSALDATIDRINAVETRLKNLQSADNKVVIGVTAKSAVTQKDARKVRADIHRSIMENGGKILLPVGLRPISQTAVDAFKADLRQKLGSITVNVQAQLESAAVRKGAKTPAEIDAEVRRGLQAISEIGASRMAGGGSGGVTESARRESLRKSIEDLTVAQLKQVARQLEVGGVSKLRRADLINKIVADASVEMVKKYLDPQGMMRGGDRSQLQKVLDTFARGVFNMLGMDPASVQAKRLPPAVSWPAQVPERPVSIGPSSTGRALPGAAAPSMLPGTRFTDQKRLVGDILSPSLKEVLRGAANAFVDSVRSEMNAAVRSVNVRDFGNAISKMPMLPAAAPQAMLPAGRRGGALAVQSELGDFYRTVEAQVRTAFDMIADYHARSLRSFQQSYQQAIKNYHQSVLSAAAGQGLRSVQVVDLGRSQPILAGGEGGSPPRLPPAGGSGFRGGGGFVPLGGFPSDGPQGLSRPIRAPQTELPKGYLTAGKMAAALKDADQYLRQTRVPLAGAIEGLASEFASATKQVLLYGTAYKALAFFMDLPNQALSAATALQTFRNQLNAVTGSSENASRSFAFIDGLADRFAVPLESVRQGFVRMYASMEPAGFGAAEIEGLFTGVSKAAATFGMSKDQVDRVTYALSQMASKGQIMAEELRGQLGDVLPGSFALFAEAAQMSIPEFTKAMEQGRFSGEAMRAVLNNVAILLNTKFASGAEGAAKTLQGALNTMGTGLQRMYESFEPLVNEVAQKVFPLIASAVSDATIAIKAFTSAVQGNQTAANALSGNARSIYDAMQGVAEIGKAIGSIFMQLLPTLELVGKAFLFVIEQIARFINTQFGSFLAGLTVQVLLLTAAFSALAKTGIALAIAGLIRLARQITILKAQKKALIVLSANLKLGLIALGGIAVLAAIKALADGLRGPEERLRAMQQRLAGVRQGLDDLAQAGNVAELTVRVQEAKAEERAAEMTLERVRAAGRLPASSRRDAPQAIQQAEQGALLKLEEARQKRIDTEKSLLNAGRVAAPSLPPPDLQPIPPAPGDLTGGAGAGAGREFGEYDGSQVEFLRQQLALEKQTLEARLQNNLISQTAFKIAVAELEFESEKAIIAEELRLELLKANRDNLSAADKALKIRDLEIVAENKNKYITEQRRIALEGITKELAGPLLDANQENLDQIDEQNMLLGRLANGYQDLSIDQQVILEIKKLIKDLDQDEIDRLKTQIALLEKSTAERLKSAEAVERGRKNLELQNRLAIAGILDPDKELRKQLEQEGLEGDALEKRMLLELQVQEAEKTKNQMVGLANSIGDTFGNAFKGIVTGAQSVRESLAGLFKGIADAFADMVAKMVAQWMATQALQGFANLFGSFSGAVTAAIPSGVDAVTTPSAVLEAPSIVPSSALPSAGPTELLVVPFQSSSPGRVSAPLPGPPTAGPPRAQSYRDPVTGKEIFELPKGSSSQVDRFANGGIALNGFQAFATGGIVKGPTLGLVGEGRFNEAVVPLPDGKSIPVELGKDGGNQIISNITITINDGKAQSSSSGGGSSEFGKRMESAVKQVIVNELRPGGVLSGRR
jgi:tape measure domain-containing protein